MAPLYEDKLLFQAYDAVPGYEGWIAFERNLLKNGGTADDHGWSYADVFNGRDDGGASGTALPAAPADNDERAIVRLRRKRLKGAHLYLVRHISNKTVTDRLSEGALLGDGEAAFNWLRNRNRVNPDVQDHEKLQQAWRDVSIVHDVGISENTIIDLDSLLDEKNSLIPNAADRFTDDEKAEKLLRAIAAASSTFSESATRELNAVMGVPGQPGVREHQHPPLTAGAGGYPRGHRHRNHATLVAYYHQQWRNAVKNGVPGFTVKAPLKHQRPGASHMLNRAESTCSTSLPGGAPLEGGLTLSNSALALRTESPTRSLQAVSEAGFSLHRGTTTTSDFSQIASHELAAAVGELAGGEESDDVCEPCAERGFTLEFCYDADDTASVEYICDNCRGLGHLRRTCPSAKKFRSFQYVAGILLRAHKRADDRAAARGNPAGGRRPPPRGQATPLKPGIPRRFQQAHPFQRGGGGGGRQDGREAGRQAETEGEPETEPPLVAETSRAAILTREKTPGVPSAFSLKDDDFFESASGAAATERPAEERGRAVAQAVISADETSASAQAAATGEAQAVAEVRVRRAAPVLGVVALVAALLTASASYLGESLNGIAAALWRAPTSVLLIGMLILCGVRGVCSSAVDAGATEVVHAAAAAREIARPRADCTLPVAEVIDGVTIEKAFNITAAQLGKYTAGDELLPEYVDMTTDSGATCVCIPAEEEWMLSAITERDPDIKLQVAADTPPLKVASVGEINSREDGIRLVCRSYRVANGVSRVLRPRGELAAPHSRSCRGWAEAWDEARGCRLAAA